MDLLDLMVKIGVDDQASSKVDSLVSGSTSKMGKLATKAGAVAGVVSSVFEKAMDVVSSSIDSAVSRVDTMNNFPRVMEGLGYSADSAAASVQLMSDHLTGLPTRLDAMTTSVQRIVPTVKDVGKATDIMLSFNDALLAGGASTQVQEAALEQFSQVLAKGKPELEDWRSIQTAMPGQLDQVAQAMLGAGASSNDLYEALKDGTVSIEDFEQAFIDLDQNGLEGFASFAEQAKTGTAGIATSFANLQNAVTKAMAKVIDAIGVENITAPIESARTAINGAADWLAGKVEWAKGILDKLGGGMDPSKFERLSNAFGAIGDGISSLGDGLQGAIDMFVESGDAAQALGDAIDAVSGFIENIAAQAGEYLMPALENAGEQLGLFGQAFQDAQAWMQPLADFLGNILVAAVIMVVDAFTLAVGIVTTVVNAVTDFVNFLMGVPANVQSFVDQVAAFFGQLPGIVSGFLLSVIAAVGTWASQTVSQGTQAASQFVSAVGAFFGQLPGNVAGFLASVISTVAGWVSDMGSKAAEAASNFGSNLMDGLWGLVSSAQQAGSAIVQGVIDGITGMISAAGDAIGSVVDTIASYLPHSPAKRGAFSGKGWTPYSGRAIVRGLAQGIAEIADEPARAMSDVMRGVSDMAADFETPSATLAVSRASSDDAGLSATEPGGGRVFNFYFDGRRTDFPAKVARLMEQLADAVELEMGMGVA